MKPVWRQRNFMLLWGGQLSSWLGTEVSGIATPLVVLQWLGATWTIGLFAGLLLVLFLLVAANRRLGEVRG